MRPLIASLAALALASSSAAAISASPGSAVSNPATMPEDNSNEVIDRYNDALINHRYDDALALASSLHPDNPTGEAIVASFRAAALIGLKRDVEARTLIVESQRLAPQSPAPAMLLFQGALFSDRIDFAGDALDWLIAHHPDTVAGIDYDTMSFFLRSQPPADLKKNDDRLIALARLGYQADTEVGHWLASDAVDALVRRGDFASAEKLLPNILEPGAVEDMLIDRHFEPLWPKLEQLGGPHLENVRKASVESAEKAYLATPDAHDKLAQYINALRHSGRLKEAIALRSKLPPDSAAMSAADEQMGWAINNVAYALHQAKMGEEADRLFASLNDAPMPKEYWRVSMKINRLELLVADRKFERALPLVEPTAKTEGSPYADQLTRRLRYCTLSQLRKGDDAAKYLPDMMAHAQDALGPTIEGLLCANQLDQAETLTLASLKNPDEKKRLSFEKDFLHELQSHALTADDPSVWQDGFKKLKQRPAIAAAFDKLGRDMPEALLPPKPDLGK